MEDTDTRNTSQVTAPTRSGGRPSWLGVQRCWGTANQSLGQEEEQRRQRKSNGSESPEQRVQHARELAMRAEQEELRRSRDREVMNIAKNGFKVKRKVVEEGPVRPRSR